MTNISNKSDGHKIPATVEQKINYTNSIVEPEEVFMKLAVTFKVLGDVTQTKIIFCLMKEELCVNDIADYIGMSQSAVSHQLRVLRNLDLVKYRRDGKISYYSLNDEHINYLFEEGLKHVKERLNHNKQ